MTKKTIELAINDARIFGESYLGGISFDNVKDSKKIENYLRRNNIDDCHLFFNHNTNEWFMIST